MGHRDYRTSLLYIAPAVVDDWTPAVASRPMDTTTRGTARRSTPRWRCSAIAPMRSWRPCGCSARCWSLDIELTPAQLDRFADTLGQIGMAGAVLMAQDIARTSRREGRDA